MGERSGDEQVVQELAGWLRERGTRFGPLRVHDVRGELGWTADGAPVAELTVLLGEPADPRQGWPAERVFQLIDAVNAEGRRRRGRLYVRVFPQPVGVGQAAENGP